MDSHGRAGMTQSKAAKNGQVRRGEAAGATLCRMILPIYAAMQYKFGTSPSMRFRWPHVELFGKAPHITPQGPAANGQCRGSLSASTMNERRGSCRQRFGDQSVRPPHAQGARLRHHTGRTPGGGSAGSPARTLWRAAGGPAQYIMAVYHKVTRGLRRIVASIGDCGSPDRGSIPLEGPFII